MLNKRKKKNKYRNNRPTGNSNGTRDALVKAYASEWAKAHASEAKKQVYDTCASLLRTIELYYYDGYECQAVTSGWLSTMPHQMNRHVYKVLYVDPERSNNYEKLSDVVVRTAAKTVRYTLMHDLNCPKDLLTASARKIHNTYLQCYVRDFSPDAKQMLECVCDNPHYQQLAFIKRKKQVLDRIPSDITQLFPEARELKRHFVLHVGDTNTGKTYDAMKVLAEAKTGGYFAPLRLLALEGQEKLLAEGVNCSMLTGEEDDIRDGATHISCTVEMLDTSTYYDVTVIDETQMISDLSRGYAWTNAILGCYSPLIHVCMSQNALKLIIRMIQSCGDSYEVVRHVRNTALVFEKKPFVFPRDIHENDALILFSRKDVLSAAAELEQIGWHPSVVYGALPYNARKEEMRRFRDHETDIVVATDAIGMGINMPIERVVFLKSAKFDGKGLRPLNISEVKQIAGRAGRMGIFDTGYVNAAVDRGRIRELLYAPYDSLTYAGIQIPKMLFSLPMKLSEIMKEWHDLSDVSIYRKVSNDHRLSMCQWLEENYPSFSKEVMWNFLCVAYDESNDMLRTTWMRLIDCIATDTPLWDHIEWKNIESMELAECEAYYKTLDLYFSFAKMFGRSYYQFKSELRKEKEAVAEKIAESLKQSKDSNQKTCRYCGKKLSVMYTYNICQKCHNKMYSGYWD